MLRIATKQLGMVSPGTLGPCLLTVSVSRKMMHPSRQSLPESPLP